MKRITTQKELKLRDGTIVPIKTSVMCEPDILAPYVCEIVLDNGTKYRVRYESIFKAPSLRTIEKYCFDAIAKTPIGLKVEPDGFDEYGFPAWPLILGYL